MKKQKGAKGIKASNSKKNAPKAEKKPKGGAKKAPKQKQPKKGKAKEEVV